MELLRLQMEVGHFFALRHESYAYRTMVKRGERKDSKTESKDSACGFGEYAFHKTKLFFRKMLLCKRFENNFRRFLKAFAQSGNLLL